MKKLFTIVLAVLMVASLWACKKDAEQESDKFPVLTDIVMRQIDGEDVQEMKTVVEYDDAYNIIGAKMYMENKLYSEIILDAATTRPLSEKDYDEDGNVEYITSYTYDANGNELSNIRKDKDGNLIWSNTYTYTAEGWVATEEWSYGDGEADWTKYTYDSHGNKISEKSGNGEEIWNEYTYENTYSGDKLTEVKSYRDGVLQELYCYDADGNPVLEIGYAEDGEEHYRSEKTYENGKLVLAVSRWSEDEGNRQEFIYNDAGELTEVRYTSFYEDESSESKTLITYDNGMAVNVKLYENGELEGEYFYNYKNEDISKEQAEKLAKIYKSEFDR